jgi:hypothetical protein
MLPDVLQAGMLAPFEALLRAVSTTVMVPIALGFLVYIYMCWNVARR